MMDFIAQFWKKGHAVFIISFVVCVGLISSYHVIVLEPQLERSLYHQDKIVTTLEKRLDSIERLLAGIKELLASKGLYEPRL